MICVVNELITSVILGVGFLQQHSLVLNFGTMPVSITSAAVTPRNGNLAVVALPRENPAVMPQEKSPPYLETLQPEENKNCSKFCAAAIVVNPSDTVEDCLIPSFGGPVAYDFPECKNDSYRSLLEEYKGVFQATATGVYHSIPTSGSPAKVPPQRVSAHYREEVEKKLEEIFQQGVIEESSSASCIRTQEIRRGSYLH